MDVNIPNKTQLKPNDPSKLNASEINLMVQGINSKADKEAVEDLASIIDDFINAQEDITYKAPNADGYLNI